MEARFSSAMVLAQALALAFPAAVRAQDAPPAGAQPSPEAEQGVGEIIVTARRREESLQDVPVAVTAFTAQDIVARGITDISELAGSTPSLTFTGGAVGGAGTSGAAQVFIRGIGQDDYLPTADPGIGIYVDGVYLGRTTGSILQLLDVERVEVLRGPQGTLFGRNTIGGAINITSRAPTDVLTASGGVTLGENDLLELRSAISGPLAASVRGRLAAMYRRQDGIGRSTLVAGDFGNVDRFAAAGSLDFGTGGRFSLRLTADYSEANQNSPAQVVTFVNNPVTGLPSAYNFFADARGVTQFTSALVTGDPYTNSATRLGYDDSRVWGTAAIATYELSDLIDLRSITAYRESESHFQGDVDSSAALINFVTVDVDQNQISQELQLLGTTGPIDWVVGGFYFREETDFQQTVDLISGLNDYLTSSGACAASPTRPTICGLAQTAATRGFRQPTNLVSTSFAGFGQATWRVTDRFSVTLGGRFTTETKDFRSQAISLITNLPTVTDPLTGSTTIVREARFDSFTPKAGLEYRATQDVLVYASFSSGFKSGTFNGRGSAGAGFTTAEPEESDAYEVGIKSDLFDNRLRLNLAAFRTDYRNLQTTVSATDSSGNIFTALLNAATARSRGFEVEATARPAANTDVGFTYSYNDAVILSATAGAQAQGLLAGNRLGKTPEHRVSAFVEQHVPLRSGEISARVDWSFQSDMFHLPTNQAQVREPAYHVVNARLGWRPTERVSVTAFVQNLLDERYAVQRSFVGSLGFATANFARPREAGLTLRFDY